MDAIPPSVPPTQSPPPAPPSESALPLPTVSSPLKPLLNPLQTDAPPPQSTTVEPPRSPNPANPATDERGNNVEIGVPSGPGSAVGPPDDVEVSQGMNGSAPVPVQAVEEDQPPLPIDAPVPPSPPPPQDEAPPVLEPGLIPPAVPTPSVITTEEVEARGGILEDAPQPATQDSTLVPDSLPAPSPVPRPASPAPVEAPQVPAPVETTPIVPAPVESTPIVPADVEVLPDVPVLVESTPIIPAPLEPTPVDSTPVEPQPSSDPMGMDVDAVGEEVPTSSAADGLGLESSASTASLKRAGEELDGPEEKRIREDPAETIVYAPPQPVDGIQPPPPVQPPWLTYSPPAPRPSGPTTPLTIPQHRHLLNAVRGLKKSKDALNFLAPVDPVLFNIPHYAQIIERPMDLGTVETKLIVSDPRGPPKDKSKMGKWDTSKGSYGSVSEVAGDVRQIWENTRKFNGPDHIVSQSASRLEATFEKALNTLPTEAPPSPAPAATPAAAPAGPSTHTRRPSVSQPPIIRRSSDDARPKREIHPPSKDLPYADSVPRKPGKRRADPQLAWSLKTLKSLESASKHYDAVAPFLYPVSEIIAALPDYATVIKQPIDLLIIKDRLTEGVYDDVMEVDRDVKLMVGNALKFNPPQHAVHTAAQQLLQLWEERWKSLPAKVEPGREESEDPLAEEFEESDDEDGAEIARLDAQIAELTAKRDALRAKQQTKRRSSTKPSKPKKSAAAKAAPAPRRQSTAKTSSPGVNGNAKKPRKSKDAAASYDDEMESEEEAGGGSGGLTLTQKQELAEKIQMADAETLQQAITIIQQTTKLGSNNEEIELDIDSLPARTVSKLYNLVCRGRKPGRAPKGSGLKKQGRKATGGASRKNMDELEEAERIRRMEAQLQSFDRPAAGYHGGMGGGGMGDDGESGSSDEESSDEE